ncbi:hypothetical protein ACWDYH_31220 [Nocardia goodfellowii]
MEVEAATVAAKAAALIADVRDAVAAQSRLDRAMRASNALEHDGAPDLPAGQPILWLNTFGVDLDEDPVGILEGRVVAEVVPLGLDNGRLQRQYLALVEAPWGGHTEKVVREDDVIPVPEHPERMAPQGPGQAIADAIESSFGDGGRYLGDPDQTDVPTPPPEPGHEPSAGPDLS